MKVKHLLATGGVVAALALSGASAVSATPDRNCSDFEHPVIIVNHYDPSHLDKDGDGIGCQDLPGEPSTSDLYADLRDEGDSTPQPTVTAPSTTPSELAHTGLGPTEHPVRYIVASVVLVGAGLVVRFVPKRSRNTL
jgi:hypothetical protein